MVGCETSPFKWHPCMGKLLVSGREGVLCIYVNIHIDVHTYIYIYIYKRMVRASGWCELLVSGSVYASEVLADFKIKTVDGQHLARDCSKNPGNHEILAYICHVN